jgi:hypothetical protein
MIDEGSDPKMRMFAIEYGGEDAEGPYTDEELLKKTLGIIRQIEPNAEIIGRECNPWSEQILAGLLPFRIHVDLVDGMPQLPAEISITWPPSEVEGIQIGNLEFREYFVWGESEKTALRKLATLNKAAPNYNPKAAAMCEE